MDLMASLEFVQAYMDDLLIITREMLDEHLQKMETVLTRLHNAGLKVNVAKSQFCAHKIEYLGYILTRDVPIEEDEQWDKMGLVDSIMEQEGPFMVDPCLEKQMTSSSRKSNDVSMNNWLKLQEQAKLHDIQTKELVASHREDQQRSVPAEVGAGKWGPPIMGPNKHVSKMVTNHHGPVHSPMKEYELGTKGQVTTMDILKRSDIWIADSGSSNHVTFSDKGCRNKRIATGSTHGIVGDSVLPHQFSKIQCAPF